MRKTNKLLKTTDDFLAIWAIALISITSLVRREISPLVRNAPHIFNLGALEFTSLFHDGRVEADTSEPSGFSTPAGASLPNGLDNVLAAQAMFPVTSAIEMAGRVGTNPVVNLTAAGNLNGVWNALAARIQAIGGYVPLFSNAFSDLSTAGDISFVHIANAIAEFEAQAWKTTDTPFDRYLGGERDAMSGSSQRPSGSGLME